MNINNEPDKNPFEDLTLKVKDFAESFVDTIHEPFLLLNKDKKIMYANKSFCYHFKVTPDETIGNLVYNIGNGQWEIPKLRWLLDEILQEKKEFKGCEVEHNFPTIGHRIMIVNARIIEVAEKHEPIILAAIEDITDIKKKENELKARNAELEEANAELERFNKLFVGREMRMIELKKIIKELEDEAASFKKTGISPFGKAKKA